ncbi:MAG: hypothetical protein IPK85_20840 [Gemmatimonadetes bacterium]|nr:hypothetical protein [Gemmatimonadota bacterium]
MASKAKPKDRVKRETLERDRPLRQGAAAAAMFGDQVTRRVEQLLDGGLKTARLVVEAAAEPVLGAAERGVHTAYTVLDEYLARGKEAAKRYQVPSPGTPDMNDNRQGNGAWGAFGPMGPMMAQAAGPWMQVARMWTDSMAQFVPGGQQAVNQWMAMWPGMTGPTGAAAGARAAVRVASTRPTTVQVSLAPDAEYMTLSTALASAAGEALGGVTISATDGRVLVSVTVADTQAVGTYRGAIVDGGGNPRGELTVDIAAA